MNELAPEIKLNQNVRKQQPEWVKEIEPAPTWETTRARGTRGAGEGERTGAGLNRAGAGKGSSGRTNGNRVGTGTVERTEVGRRSRRRVERDQARGARIKRGSSRSASHPPPSRSPACIRRVVKKISAFPSAGGCIRATQQAGPIDASRNRPGRTSRRHARHRVRAFGTGIQRDRYWISRRYRRRPRNRRSGWRYDPSFQTTLYWPGGVENPGLPVETVVSPTRAFPLKK